MAFKKLGYALVLVFTLVFNGYSQNETKEPTTPTPALQPAAKWYDKINIRGYAQLRYNQLFVTNPDLTCEQCDRSWGREGGFFFRRIRLIFSGQLHERVSFYIQPDLASSPATGVLNFAQIRDAYFDLSLDEKGEYRFRFGQSKVPFGFENLQSSQNRIPLDRNDAMNSALSNERDLGVFFYWAPKHIRDLFKELQNSKMKGSGDYGVFGIGIHNGQTANKSEENADPTGVVRLTYPIKIGKQIIEPGIQAYRGKVEVTSVTSGVTGNPDFEYLDQRLAGTMVLYSKPFGILAEYNVGTGPEYNPVTNTIDQQKLKGGFVTASYLKEFGDHVLIPFTRYHYYDGGKKHERDARSYTVKELEIGVEWQLYKTFELVAMYTISDRRFEDAQRPINTQDGSLLRVQVQVNIQ